jgi:tetratricopeptide (TPR) repeat protein
MKGHHQLVRYSLFAAFAAAFLCGAAAAQIPGQVTVDYPAGEAPSAEEVAKVEKEVAAKPDDYELVRKLGKGYFFRFFGARDAASVPKAQATLERALALKKDDPESLAYLGALHVFAADRLEAKGSEKQKAGYDKGFEILRHAEKVAPRLGSVVSIASASYVILPDSYGMIPHVIEMIEGMRKAMGPMFARFHHHGQQRLLMTLGQAYARQGDPEKAKALFDEALAIDTASREAGLIKRHLADLERRSSPISASPRP